MISSFVIIHYSRKEETPSIDKQDQTAGKRWLFEADDVS